jgi:hypothetical protein
MTDETNTTQMFRDLQEFCGEYNPKATNEIERFTLKAGTESIPIFLETEEDFPAQYPEVRIIPITDIPRSRTSNYEKEKGNGKFEDPNVEYIKKRTDTTSREVEVQIDIFTKDFILLTKARDKLAKRLHGLFYPELEEICAPDDAWNTKDDKIFDNYEMVGIDLVKAYDNGILLKKVNSPEELVVTDGSWSIDMDGLHVNPLTNTDNLTFMSKINGFVFSDGLTALDKGYKALRIMMSRIVPDEDPEVQRWIFEIMFTFKEVEEMNVGSSFGEIAIEDITTDR